MEALEAGQNRHSSALLKPNQPKTGGDEEESDQVDRLMFKSCFGRCQVPKHKQRHCRCLLRAVVRGEKTGTFRSWHSQTVARFQRHVRNNTHVRVQSNWSRASSIGTARMHYVSRLQSARTLVTDDTARTAGYTNANEYIQFECANNPDTLVTYIQFRMCSVTWSQGLS